MAAKTDISTYEFVEILKNYSLGSFLESKPIPQGTVQTNYIVQTTQTRLVLRYYENRSELSVQFEVHVIQYLSERGYPCPAPLKNNDEKFIGMHKGKPYVLYEFIEGEHVANPNKDQINQLIEQAAKLHLLTRNYRTGYAKYRLNYNTETCKRLATENSERLNTENSREKLKWYYDALSNLQLPKSLPKGICHCDFHFTNILFRDGQFKALLDFDDANFTYLLFDLVYLLEPFKASFDWNTWNQFERNEDVFDFANARSVLQEYTKYRQLNAIEKRHLFDVLKLSILVDCIWYFERGDEQDFFEKRKLAYLDQLGRDKFYQYLFGD